MPFIQLSAPYDAPLPQETQAKAATKDLVALAAADPGLPPHVAQAGRLSLLELALLVTRCPCIKPSRLGRP